MSDQLKLPRLARDLFGTEIEARKAEGGPLELTFSASSEAPVERYFGTEILRHDAKAIRMERLNGGAAPLLFNHNWDDPIGMLTGGRLKDGRLVVDARLFDTERAREVRAMLDGGLRNVSIGYEIHEMAESRGTYEAVDWTLLEASIVTIPADPSVGIGRNAEDQAVKPVRIHRAESEPAQPATTKEANMADNLNAPAGATADISVTENGTAAQRATPVELEQARKTAIRNLAMANKIDERIQQHWIATGASLEQVADDLLKIHAERGKQADAPAMLGMEAKDVRRYSVLRAMRAMMSKDWSKAGLELEAHKAVMSRHSINPRSESSFFVPMDIQMRDMTAAGASGSNYLVSTDNLAGSFVDLLRNESVIMNMGATRLSGLQGNVTIPRQTAAGTAYVLANENTAITESQPTLGQITLSPKNIAALTEISHQLMQQNDPSAEQLVMTDLARTVALKADLLCISGSGSSGEPTGIVNTVGIGTFDTDGTDTWGDVLSALQDVAAANALRDGCAFVADPASAVLLMKRFTNATYGEKPIWDGSMLRGTMAGFPAVATNQMSANTMLFGWWPSLIVAEWGVLELSTNPYSDFTRGLTAIRAWYTMDFAMRYPAAFTYDATVA